MATAARSAASALAVAPRSSTDPGGHSHLAAAPGRDSTLRQPPAGIGGLAQGAGVPPGLGEVPVVAEPDQALPAGGIHVPVGEFGRVQRDRQRLGEAAG